MLGERLHSIRKLRGITQAEIADMLKVKRQTYSAYERNISVPDAITLKILADYLDVSTEFFFEGPPPASDSSDNAQEEKLRLIARLLKKLPKESSDRLIKSFDDNVHLYLEMKEKGN